MIKQACAKCGREWKNLQELYVRSHGPNGYYKYHNSGAFICIGKAGCKKRRQQLPLDTGPNMV